jgi:hypothetical protein
MRSPNQVRLLVLFTLSFLFSSCARFTDLGQPVDINFSPSPNLATPTAAELAQLPSTSTPLDVTKEIPTLPQDEYSRSDQFGDGYIAKVKVDEVKEKSPEDVVIILVTQWLEHYKHESGEPAAAIDDYTIDAIRMLDNSPGGTYVFVAGVNFSVIPKETLNVYRSFPGKPIDPNSPWDVIGAPFGVIQVDDYYYLRLVFGWGT